MGAKALHLLILVPKSTEPRLTNWSRSIWKSKENQFDPVIIFLVNMKSKCLPYKFFCCKILMFSEFRACEKVNFRYYSRAYYSVLFSIIHLTCLFAFKNHPMISPSQFSGTLRTAEKNCTIQWKHKQKLTWVFNLKPCNVCIQDIIHRTEMCFYTPPSYELISPAFDLSMHAHLSQ